VAAEEAINLFAELIESQGSIVSNKAYGGQNALSLQSFFWTPGITTFATLPAGPFRGGILAGGRLFAVSGGFLYELSSAGVLEATWGAIPNDGNQVTIVYNSLQLLIVGAGRAFCFTLASNTLLEVTAQLAGTPLMCEASDTYFIVMFQNSNKFQMSQVLNGNTWPGQLVNEVSVFPENIVSIRINHRELWVYGINRTQVYEDTGSTEIYDVVPSGLIEIGCASALVTARADNSIFWIHQDERGGRMAWRSNGYTPTRISTHAVEYDLSTYTAAQIAAMASYAYQDAGHLFWVLYIPGSSWSWVFDVTQQMWHKRAKWVNNVFAAHWGWNHIYAFGMHLIGDWASANLYDMEMKYFADNGTPIRRLRQSPTVGDEMKFLMHKKITIDFETGLGPQPPLLDGAGNVRAPQCMLQWSDDRGKTWSAELFLNCGQAGNFRVRAVMRRLGRSRYRVYRVILTDPIPWTIVDAYLVTDPTSGEP
jgi:hypothetical protein